MKFGPAKLIDGLKWRCRSKRCKDYGAPVRKGTQFEKMKTSLRNIIKILYEWSKNTPIKG